MTRDFSTQPPEVSRKQLRPSAVLNCIRQASSLSDAAVRALVALGFTPLEASPIVERLCGVPLRWNAFGAVPKDRQLPSPMQELSAEYPRNADFPEMGLYRFDVTVWMCTTNEEIVKSFRAWLRAQRKLLKVPEWDERQSRDLSIFIRDVIVYSLRNDRAWTCVLIDKQLEAMGLPRLTSTEREIAAGAAKSARRRICHEMHSFLQGELGRRLLNPFGSTNASVLR